MLAEIWLGIKFLFFALFLGIFLSFGWEFGKFLAVTVYKKARWLR